MSTLSHFWHISEHNMIRMALWITDWKIEQVLTLVTPTAMIRFATVGGYDQNNSYVEHNNWETINNYKEPASLALQVFKLNEVPAEIIKSLKKLDFTISKFAFETSNDFFYQGSTNGQTLFIQISIPISEWENFSDKIAQQFTQIANIIKAEKNRAIWFVFEKEQIIACLPFIEYPEKFYEIRLDQIINRLEEVQNIRFF